MSGLTVVGSRGGVARAAGEDAAPRGPALAPAVVSIVGIDGCGKTSTFEAALRELAREAAVVGVGDRVLAGAPAVPVHERRDVPRAGLTRVVGRLAKGLRVPILYKNVKFLDLTERTRLVDHVRTHETPEVVLCDGDPLVNTGAWAVARFARDELAGDDDALDEGLALLARERTIPLRGLPAQLRRSWQLTLLNRLRLGRFAYPDLVVFLRIEPAVALARIRSRARPLQAHETEAFLAELDHAYERVCELLERRRGLTVVRLPVGELSPDETVARVVAATREHLAGIGEAGDGSGAIGGRIDVIATTMSGSIEDQRKVGRIAPEFRRRTPRPVRVRVARSHVEAQEQAHAAVRGGARVLVSAGGAGTFNAVLEGAHVEGRVPDDLRLAFLRKGSADLIGKVLGIPDTLPEAVAAIVGGIESGDTVAADVLAVGAAAPDGAPATRHLVGFGGFGIFGEIPRFTESRFVKAYKGVLGQLFGDLGPFMTGFALATAHWTIERLLGRGSRLSLVLDGEELPPQAWSSVILLNGDLGPDFRLGRGLDLASGTFRVIALRYLGPRELVRQAVACRTAAVLDDPERHGAVVATVRRLTVRPEEPGFEQLVNVDGLKLLARGPVTVSVESRVALVPGRPGAG
ncbi:MAG: diacylglycerol kinase family protein [Thermoleophilia bacterium]|nr:diacylglycerol kinase family protein [Thermoleophilia bacterium]